MLAYYPLEHLYYLLSHDIIPDKIALPSATAFVPFIRTQPSSKSIQLDLGKLGLWSTRFWAAYVVLQLAHLREDSKLLQMRERTLSKTKVRMLRCEESPPSRLVLFGSQPAVCSQRNHLCRATVNASSP